MVEWTSDLPEWAYSNFARIVPTSEGEVDKASVRTGLVRTLVWLRAVPWLLPAPRDFSD